MKKTKMKKKKKETKKQANTRKKSLIYTLIALGFIILIPILKFDWDWFFIVPAVFFLYLGRKYLLG